MKPIHSTLDPLLSLPDITAIRICFLSEDTPDRNALYLWLPSRNMRQLLYQFIKHYEIAAEALSFDKCDAFIIFEHKPHYSFFLYTVLILKGKPVLFLVHGLQQLYTRSLFHQFGFRILQSLVSNFSFHPIHLEKDDQLLPYSAQFKSKRRLTIPLPHPFAEERGLMFGNKWRQTLMRVGVVGLFRPDKPTQRLIELLVSILHDYPNSFELVVGTPFWQKPSWLDCTDVEIVDTGDEANYSRLLANIHISVQDFYKNDYYFRPSGTINDAGMHECFVICPKYPVFETQIATPVAIGSAFESLDELPTLLMTTLKWLGSNTPDFASWKSYRSMAHIAPNIGAFIDSQ